MTPETTETEWDITLLYDGDCPLCLREVRMLERRNDRGRLRTVDIAAADFEPAVYGLEQQQVMARIHGVLPDGRVVEGMEVFRRAYAAVGLGWLLAPSRWPLVGRLFDRAYAWFARNRLRLTGRAGSCDEHCSTEPPGAESAPSQRPVPEDLLHSVAPPCDPRHTRAKIIRRRTSGTGH